MGNAHPSVFPYEPLPTADNDLIVAAANDGQFRKLCEVLGIPEVADDPRFARNADRTANREELRPLLVERLAQRGAVEWFDAARRRRGAVRADQHDRRRVRDGGAVRARPGRRGRRGGAGHADHPAPDPVLRDPGRLPAAAARAGRARRGAAQVARRRRRRTGMPEYPTALGRLQPRDDHAARPRPRRGRHGRRSGSASWRSGSPPSAARRRARPGCSRPCSPRSPTTASPRPRSSPGSPTCRRRTRCRARSRPGCSAAGRGSSASPRTAAGSCTTCSPASTSCPSTTPAGTPSR